MTSTHAPSRGRKSLALAALLQGIPFVAAGGCVAAGSGPSDDWFGTGLLLGLSALLWGLGYLYVGRWGRFLAAFTCGPILAIASCSLAVSGSTYDFEHPDYNEAADLPSAKRGLVAAGLLLSVYVSLLTLGAVMLARARNVAIEALAAASNTRGEANAP